MCGAYQQRGRRLQGTAHAASQLCTLKLASKHDALAMPLCRWKKLSSWQVLLGAAAEVAAMLCALPCLSDTLMGRLDVASVGCFGGPATIHKRGRWPNRLLQVVKGFDFSKVYIKTMVVEANGHDPAKDQAVTDHLAANGETVTKAFGLVVLCHTSSAQSGPFGRIHAPDALKLG